jgi:hypothetical protein
VAEPPLTRRRETTDRLGVPARHSRIPAASFIANHALPPDRGRQPHPRSVFGVRLTRILDAETRRSRPGSVGFDTLSFENGRRIERHMPNPDEPMELMLSDWRLRGGPSRWDRLKAEYPVGFAAAGALLIMAGPQARPSDADGAHRVGQRQRRTPSSGRWIRFHGDCGPQRRRRPRSTTAGSLRARCCRSRTRRRVTRRRGARPGPHHRDRLCGSLPVRVTSMTRTCAGGGLRRVTLGGRHAAGIAMTEPRADEGFRLGRGFPSWRSLRGQLAARSSVSPGRSSW